MGSQNSPTTRGASFYDCSFCRFGSIVLTNRHTDTQTDVDDRYNTPATHDGVSNNDEL